MRFTALIVGVLVLGIALYVIVDAAAAGVRLDASLRQRAERAAQRVARVRGNAGLPDDSRIIEGGRVIAGGEQTAGITELGPLAGFGYVDSTQGRLRVYAVALGDGRSVQLADAARPAMTDNAGTALELLVVAALVGVVTYFLGLRFSRRALAPVHESIARLERFTADVGHELRTPLASVRASLDVAERTGDWNAAVDRARAELDRASALVDRLLELARLDPSAVVLETVDLHDALVRVVGLCAPMAEERSIAVNVVGMSGKVSADPVLLERLVANLLANAIRFGDRGSTVTLSFCDESIEVHNVGEAIPPEDLPHVFEPFYQADRSRTGEGSGLGLAIAAVIAQAHSWSLGAASSPGAGTTFVVTVRAGKATHRP